MASPAHSAHPIHRVAYAPRYRRSSFNGAKQLSAAQAPDRRILMAVGFLVVALVVAAGTIAFSLASS